MESQTDYSDNYNWPNNPIVKLTKLAEDQDYFLTVDGENEWVADIIAELDKDIEPEDLRTKTTLLAKLSFKKIKKREFGDAVLLHMKLDLNFTQSCIRCLCPVPESLSLNIDAIFVDEKTAQNPDYEELTDLFVNEIECELHEQKNKEIHLNEFIRESIIINRNQFPLHEEDCKGLCQQCGADLNKEPCEHSLD